MERKDIRCAVVTVSDRSFEGTREDLSGKVLTDLLTQNGFTVSSYSLVPDERKTIADELVRLTEKTDLIITTGGTGLSPRDTTPEATMDIATRNVPGIAEAIRSESLKKTPHAMLSRAVCVIRNSTLIINFPGSPKACREAFEVVLPALDHAISIIRGEKADG